MSKTLTRKALENELDQIYMMGFDVWGENSEKDYLRGCRESAKYKSGTWYVLLQDNHLLSSLILYNFRSEELGIGSIATPPHLRNKGYASKIIKDVIEIVEKDNPQGVLFLYSDIHPEFYEKFQFIKLPPHLQRYQSSICMIRGQNIERYLSQQELIPKYF